MAASKEKSKSRVTENKVHLPVCKVCFPPDNTPRGRVPVGVRPLSVNTFSLSSLVHKQKKDTHTHTQIAFQEARAAARTPAG